LRLKQRANPKISAVYPSLQIHNVEQIMWSRVTSNPAALESAPLVLNPSQTKIKVSFATKDLKSRTQVLIAVCKNMLVHPPTRSQRLCSVVTKGLQSCN
jgi:hypothetical protein